MTRAPLEKAESDARSIARILKQSMPEGWGYILHLMSFGGDGFSTYMSSVLREDAIRYLEEWIEAQRALAETSEFVDGTGPSCWCCGAKSGLVTMRGQHRSVVVCNACVETKHDAKAN